MNRHAIKRREIAASHALAAVLRAYTAPRGTATVPEMVLDAERYGWPATAGPFNTALRDQLRKLVK